MHPRIQLLVDYLVDGPTLHQEEPIMKDIILLKLWEKLNFKLKIFLLI
jgi:hypothetical protein